MKPNQLSIITLFLASLTFVGMAIATTVRFVATPVTVNVIAPVAAAASAAAVGGGINALPSLLAIAQDDNQPVDQRNKAIEEIAAMTGGDVAKGQAAFKKNCEVCHKVNGDGADHAPDLSEVASRLTRQKIVESIVQPSAVVEEKYKTTMVATLDGEVLTGLLTEQADGVVKLFDGKETREISEEDIDIMQTKEQSSMPVKLADAMAEGEFLGIVEYLSGLKKPE